MSETEQERFLLKDFEKIHDFRVSFSEKRLTALGTCLTVLGLVVSLNDFSKFYSSIGALLVMYLIVFTGIRVIGALSRGMAVFADHLSWIELQLGQTGLASYWGAFVQRNTHYSGSHAFIVACHAMNAAVVLFGIVVALVQLRADSKTTLPLAVFLVLSIVLYFWNEVAIYRGIDPRGYYSALRAAMAEARKETLKRDQESGRQEE